MFQEEIDKLWIKLMMIGYAICIGSPILYTVVVYVIRQTPDFGMNSDPAMSKMLNYILIGIIILIILPALYFLKRKFLNSDFSSSQTFSQSGENISPVISTVTVYYIIICAICEIPAILGLMYGILGGLFNQVIIYEILTIVFFLKFTFRKSEIEAMFYFLAEKHGLS